MWDRRTFARLSTCTHNWATPLGQPTDIVRGMEREWLPSSENAVPTKIQEWLTTYLCDAGRIDQILLAQLAFRAGNPFRPCNR